MTHHVLKNSDICLSIRTIDENRTAERALALMEDLHPTRIEWSYVTDRELIARFRNRAPVFVATLNTIFPAGHAEAFTGEPIVAPWMTRFGSPDKRMPYICQNNPDDLRIRIEQATAFLADDITASFQFDDWYGNAQMLGFGNPCFCPHCMREFRIELGIDIDYRAYLRQRGFTHAAQILAAAAGGGVPLWEDFARFQKRTVTRFFRRLRAELDQAAAMPVCLSVNGSVLNFGGDIETVLPFLTYCHSETPDWSPQALVRLEEASRRLGTRQIVSFFPSVPVAEYHDPVFVGRINQTIGLCYCLGLLPLFPYDVYAGNEPDGAIKDRWFGTWEEYRRPYEIVRERPEIVDDYVYSTCSVGEDGAVVVVSEHAHDPNRKLRHTLTSDGDWTTVSL